MIQKKVFMGYDSQAKFVGGREGRSSNQIAQMMISTEYMLKDHDDQNITPFSGYEIFKKQQSTANIGYSEQQIYQKFTEMEKSFKNEMKSQLAIQKQEILKQIAQQISSQDEYTSEQFQVSNENFEIYTSEIENIKGQIRSIQEAIIELNNETEIKFQEILYKKNNDINLNSGSDIDQFRSNINELNEKMDNFQSKISQEINQRVNNSLKLLETNEYITELGSRMKIDISQQIINEKQKTIEQIQLLKQQFEAQQFQYESFQNSLTQSIEQIKFNQKNYQEQSLINIQQEISKQIHLIRQIEENSLQQNQGILSIISQKDEKQSFNFNKKQFKSQDDMIKYSLSEFKDLKQSVDDIQVNYYLSTLTNEKSENNLAESKIYDQIDLDKNIHQLQDFFKESQKIDQKLFNNNESDIQKQNLNENISNISYISQEVLAILNETKNKQKQKINKQQDDENEFIQQEKQLDQEDVKQQQQSSSIIYDIINKEQLQQQQQSIIDNDNYKSQQQLSSSSIINDDINIQQQQSIINDDINKQQQQQIINDDINKQQQQSNINDDIDKQQQQSNINDDIDKQQQQSIINDDIDEQQQQSIINDDIGKQQQQSIINDQINIQQQLQNEQNQKNQIQLQNQSDLQQFFQLNLSINTDISMDMHPEMNIELKYVDEQFLKKVNLKESHDQFEPCNNDENCILENDSQDIEIDQEEEIIYQLDDDGFLIDENGNFIMDENGQSIKLTQEHIEYLRTTDILQEEIEPEEKQFVLCQNHSQISNQIECNQNSINNNGSIMQNE